MILINEKYTNNLNNILKKIDYVYIIKNLRNISDFIDPWFEFDNMLSILEKFDFKNKNSIKLLYMGISVEIEQLKKELNQEEIDLMIESGIWYKDNDLIKTNNLIVLIYQGLKILTEINPHFKTCQNRKTNIYIGFDSLRLAENIYFDKNSKVLDLCSGTGIQGLLAAKSAKKVVSVEINPIAVNIIKFNTLLNNLYDIIEVRQGNLYDVLNYDEKFDYIYANPPFIPMINDVEYPICGSGGIDGLDILNEIVVDNLNKFLEDTGEVVIFSQCLGNKDKIFFNDVLENEISKYNYKVICVIKERIPIDYQLDTLTELTNKFNDNFDYNLFKEKMKEIYNTLNASYLYTLIYKICKVDSSNKGIYIIDQSNKWDLDYTTSFLGDINIIEDKNNFELILNNERIGFVDIEAKDIINLLLEGYSLREVTEDLFEKYKDNFKYQKYGKSEFICSILNTCLKLENMGVLRKGC